LKPQGERVNKIFKENNDAVSILRALDALILFFDKNDKKK